jgi:hypothetical protein
MPRRDRVTGDYWEIIGKVKHAHISFRPSELESRSYPCSAESADGGGKAGDWPAWIVRTGRSYNLAAQGQAYCERTSPWKRSFPIF